MKNEELSHACMLCYQVLTINCKSTLPGLINDCYIRRIVLSLSGPVQDTCYGNGEDAAKPEGSGGEI